MNLKTNPLDIIRKTKGHEKGSIMFIALLIMAITVIIGVTAIETSRVELNIAGNDALHRQAFYEADSGVDLMIELLVQNIEKAGFDPDSNGKVIVGDVKLSKRNFYMNPYPTDFYPTDSYSDAVMPKHYDADSGFMPHNNLLAGGNSRLAPGSGIVSGSGYSGLGQSASAGGTFIPYGTGSQRVGVRKSTYTVASIYRYIVGLYQ